jgi:hypothetical protein
MSGDPFTRKDRVAVWRKRALEDFPHLRRRIDTRGYTIYSLLTDLLVELDRALEISDDDALHRLFALAEWCLRQKDLNNAAAVGFYEHVLQRKQGHWPTIIRRLSPFVVQEVWPLWEWLLAEDYFLDLQKRLEAQGKPITIHQAGLRSRPKRR